jgi:flagellar hook-length control protein FliK
MNLNISTQSINNFLGNNNIKDNTSNKSEFDDIFENIGVIEEDNNLELIQNILNNINIMDFRQPDDENKSLDLQSENVETNLDLLSQIGEALKENENYKQILNNNNVKVEDTENSQAINGNVKLENNEIYEFINESMQAKNIDVEDLIKLKEMLNQKSMPQDNLNLDVKETSNSVIKDGENDFENLEAKINNEINKLSAYKQLEVSSLSNKTNIVENNSSNLDKKDKDLNTLESILDGKSENNFMFTNNNLNAVNPQNSQQSISKDVPISTVRQEFIGDDVVKTIKYLKSNGIEEIKIKISPRELGDMTIKLIKNHEETKVLITLSKEDSFDMVNKNLGDITKHLGDMNIKVKDISVDVKTDNQKLFSDNLNQEFDKKNKENKKKRSKYGNIGIENIEEIKEKDRVDENINILI